MPKEMLFTPYVGYGRLLRAHMMINGSDFERFNALPKEMRHPDHQETVEVFDNVSQSRYTVRRADCGSGCYCAAEIVQEGGAT